MYFIEQAHYQFDLFNVTFSTSKFYLDGAIPIEKCLNSENPRQWRDVLVEVYGG